jgi:tRNA (adenine-N(1)-)-methyltransferase non-catalytic subunit
LIGLPYGTVLEVGRDGLVPLPEGEDLLPGDEGVWEALDEMESTEASNAGTTSFANGAEINANSTDSTKHITPNDNRDIHDTNTSQTLTQQQVNSMTSNTEGSQIVAALISNSATFASKTAFSQAKYIKRKQMKHQLRCRIVRITPETLCTAMHLKDSRRICNLRSDTLGFILSSANISAGQRVLVMDNAVQGIIAAAVTRRMGGYGSVFALFEGQQPAYLEVVQRMNFNLMERQALKWVGLGEVFASDDDKEAQVEALKDGDGQVVDVEKRDRESIQWPCPLMSHTRNYLLNEVKDEKKIKEFLDKRCARFTRKLTRLSMLEMREMIDSCKEKEEDVLESGSGDCKDDIIYHQSPMDTENNDNLTSSLPQSIVPKEESVEISQCDSIIIATKYDPTITILRLLPYLAPSCPFVIFHEFLEPLLETFRTLQNGGIGDNELIDMPMMCRRNIAINLRLTDTWFREYQVLEGRTHPNMHMSQNGGYLLMGTKLCPKTGTNEMDAETVRMLRAKLGPTRRPKKGGDKEGTRGKRKIIDKQSDVEKKQRPSESHSR